jgi:hypothetical protein
MGNSTFPEVDRELPAGERQQRKETELIPEQLAETIRSRLSRGLAVNRQDGIDKP